MPVELGLLTAMITPAVLISACSALILSTSVRLGRIVDRVRSLSDRFEALARTEPGSVELLEERLDIIFTQLDQLTTRARLLQRGMTSFYLALGVFVATSVSIGLQGVLSQSLEWIPVVLGLAGAGLLFYGSVLLGFEATIALKAIHAEMDFLWRIGRHYAPKALLERRNLTPPGSRS